MATDPLSLAFICCFLVGALFLGIASLFGGGHHLGHSGHAFHAGHSIHAGHGHVVPGGAHAPASASALTSSAPLHMPSASQQALAHPADTPQSTAGFAFHGLLDYLSPLSIATFLTLFGLAGYILHNYTSLAVSIIFALALLIGAFVVFLALRLLNQLGAEAGVLSERSSELAGTLARVSMRIRPGGVGEVIYLAEQGTRHSVGARSIDGAEIARDAEVVIVDYRDGVAYVQEWNAFLRDNALSNQQPAIGTRAAPPPLPPESGQEETGGLLPDAGS